MGNRSGWWASVASAVVAVLLIIMGSVAPEALAKPKDKGVPPGQPFQALQRQIDELRADLNAITSPGIMWINTLDSRAGAATTLLTLDATAPGLLVSAAADDVLQVGLQVPRGMVITGVTVCYVSGAAVSPAFINNVSLLQYAATAAAPPTAALNENIGSAPAPSTLSCIETATVLSVDPNSAGPVYLSLGLAFPAADAIAIRGIGLQLEVPAP